VTEYRPQAKQALEKEANEIGSKIGEFRKQSGLKQNTSKEDVLDSLNSAYRRLDALGKWYTNGASTKTTKYTVPPSGTNQGVPARQTSFTKDQDLIREIMTTIG